MNTPHTATIARRRHVRVPLPVDAYIYCAGQPRTTARITDVSLSGITLFTPGEDGPAVADRIYVEFSLPFDRDVPVMAIGTVVWLREEDDGQTAGVEVVKLFPASRTALRSYVDRRRNQQLNYNVLDG